MLNLGAMIDSRENRSKHPGIEKTSFQGNYTEISFKFVEQDWKGLGRLEKVFLSSRHTPTD
jgi:hypothetical protein